MNDECLLNLCPSSVTSLLHMVPVPALLLSTSEAFFALFDGVYNHQKSTNDTYAKSLSFTLSDCEFKLFQEKQGPQLFKDRHGGQPAICLSISYNWTNQEVCLILSHA